MTTTTSSTSTPELLIRLAAPGEHAAVARLAALDSAAVPGGDVLVAEVDGELWAAVSLDDARVVADPFRPAGDVLPLLIERGRQLQRRPRRRTRRGVFRGRPALV